MEIETFLSIKNLQFSSDFEFLYHFGISIGKFHNKILIWGRSGDLNFWPLITKRSKLWRPLALSPEVTETPNFDCDLLTLTHSHGVTFNSKFKSLIFSAHANRYCKKTFAIKVLHYIVTKYSYVSWFWSIKKKRIFHVRNTFVTKWCFSFHSVQFCKGWNKFFFAMQKMAANRALVTFWSGNLKWL